MPAVTRLSDNCTGHGPYPPRQSTSGSPDVFVNGLPLHRVSDTWATHCAGTCHDSVLSEGSPTVFCNNLPIGRIGDIIACGSQVATGSPNVFSGN
jgi:uncharacterized Zn-binding protein involved in type VI secretion